jgi:hypothetical protein
MAASRPKTVAHTGNTHVNRRTCLNSKQDATSKHSDSISRHALPQFRSRGPAQQRDT